MRFISAWMLLVFLVGGASAQPLRLVLPTDNEGMLTGDEPSFYQYTNRNFQGRRSYPWQGGQYGFVRNQREVGSRIVFTRFHEGVDIRPVRRDANQEPLDEVRAIDRGQVVHVNDVERHSNYGLYVVVEHWWDGAPFYTLYAHLAETDVEPNTWVERGQKLGRMGYTGVGINRTRAHTHFEINVLLSRRFQIWYDANYNDENWHGIHNGINMAGLSVPDLYLRLQQDSTLTIRDFFEEQEPFFSVTVPNIGRLDLLERYPWMWRNADQGEQTSWEIAFSQSGLPLGVLGSGRVVMRPVVSMAQPSAVAYNYNTNGLLSGTADVPALTERGERYIELLMIPAEEPVLPRSVYEWW